MLLSICKYLSLIGYDNKPQHNDAPQTEAQKEIKLSSCNCNVHLF